MNDNKLKDKQEAENTFSDNRYIKTLIEMDILQKESENLDDESLVDEVMEYLANRELMKHTSTVVDTFFRRNLKEDEQKVLKGTYILIHSKCGLME